MPATSVLRLGPSHVTSSDLFILPTQYTFMVKLIFMYELCCFDTLERLLQFSSSIPNNCSFMAAKSFCGLNLWIFLEVSS